MPGEINLLAIQGEIKLWQDQFKMKIKKFGHLKSSLDRGDFWWPSWPSFISYLGWQPLPKITKMANMNPPFNSETCNKNWSPLSLGQSSTWTCCQPSWMAVITKNHKNGCHSTERLSMKTKLLFNLNMSAILNGRTIITKTSATTLLFNTEICNKNWILMLIKNPRNIHNWTNFDYLHVWHQNGPHHVWASLCQVFCGPLP